MCLLSVWFNIGCVVWNVFGHGFDLLEHVFPIFIMAWICRHRGNRFQWV